MIFNECTKNEPEKRPVLTKLIDYFYNIFIFQKPKEDFLITNNINDKQFYPYLFSNNKYFKLFFNNYFNSNNNKCFDLFFKEAHNIHLVIQNNLGLLYYPIEYLEKTLDLLPKESIGNATYFLGFYYYEGKYTIQNIDKAFHYLTLAADQNNKDAQCILGFIYYDGKYIKQDIWIAK